MRRTAVVTGAGRGIGRAIGELLLPDAWLGALDVEVPDNSLFDADFEVDVTDVSAVNDTIERIANERDGIDWVVCAAGITRDRVSWKMDDDDWTDVLNVNLTGAFNVARAATPHLRKSEHGRLVFISSINGARASFGQANYSASKAGLIGMAKTMAFELARDGVTVNCVLPGFIDTPMTQALDEEMLQRAVERTPLKRLGHVNDVAAAVQFLCDDDAAFITGVALPVDGGQLLGVGGTFT